MLNVQLRGLRDSKGIQQKDAANDLGISQQVYSNYELGKCEPDYDTVVRLAEYFSVSTDYLLGKPVTNETKKEPAIFDEIFYMDMDKHITIRNFQEYVKKKEYNPGIDGKLGMVLKFMEESGELAQAMLKNYPHATGDEIKNTIEEEFYDVLYCICALANLYDVDIEKWIPVKARTADKKWNTPGFFEENFKFVTGGNLNTSS